MSDDMYYTKAYAIHNPTMAGCVVMGDSVKIFMRRKPHFIARFLYRLLLDWKWEDVK